MMMIYLQRATKIASTYCAEFQKRIEFLCLISEKKHTLHHIQGANTKMLRPKMSCYNLLNFEKIFFLQLVGTVWYLINKID